MDADDQLARADRQLNSRAWFESLNTNWTFVGSVTHEARGHGWQSDRSQTQATDYRPQTTGHRLQATDYRPQTTGHRLQATDYRPQTPFSRA